MNRVEKLKKKKRFYKKTTLSKKEILLELKILKDKFVFVPTDKAGNNYKKREFGIFGYR